jgi:2-polyprenyl-6-methoxyphenol hydroxylase-like FAD-dependent oxidoreductase
MPDYDVITVGGGLGGAALAKVLGGGGLRVLVLEREEEFSDRIRGEFLVPWGGAEAQKLGLYDVLLASGANEQPYWNVLGNPVRDLSVTTPQKLPGLTFFHPAMQEVVIEEARRAGAEVWRGATVSQIRAGNPPAITVEARTGQRQLTARVVVCADGRNSVGRIWAGFTPRRGRQRLLIAGVMLEETDIATDTALVAVNPPRREVALLVPQGRRRARGFLIYPGETIRRLQGEGDLARLIDECVQAGMPRECYAGSRPVGPLASFDATATWVEHPYRPGVTLLGDAAGASDPTWGQGLSLTLRDVRVLSEHLLGSEDWEAAGHEYAQMRDSYFKTELTVEDWLFELMLGDGAEAEARRARAMPLLAAEPDRYPDHHFSGPDLPCDERIRRRLFGEE